MKNVFKSLFVAIVAMSVTFAYAQNAPAKKGGKKEHAKKEKTGKKDHKMVKKDHKMTKKSKKKTPAS